MSTKLPDLGAPPSSLDPELRRYFGLIRSHLRELRGNSGDLAGVAGTGGGGGGGTTIVVPGGPAPAPSPSDPPDPTPPPTPTGVLVDAGLNFVFIKTDAPVFTEGHGYGRTIVYGAKYSGSGPLPTFGAAVVQHEFVGQVGDFSSEPKTQWHIWVKWKSRDGYESTVPFGGTNGVQVTTGNDVTKLLEALTGQITASQLFTDLEARIDLIDGPTSLFGSVAQRLLDESNARTTAITTEATIRAAADSSLASRTDVISAAFQSGALNADPQMSSFSEFWTSEAGSVTRVTGSSATRFAFRSTAQANYFDKRRIPFDRSKTYRVSVRARSSSASAPTDGLLYIVIKAFDAAGADVPNWGFGGSYSFYPIAGYLPTTTWADYSVQFSAAAQSFPTSVTAISIGVIQSYVAGGGFMEVEQLRLTDDTAAADFSAVNAAIISEQSARANADTALATSLSGLTATVNSNNSSTAAAIANEAAVRASADSSLSSSIDSLLSTVNTNNSTLTAAILSEASTRANADTALSTTISGLAATVSSNNSTLTSALTTESAARASGDATNASSITTLQSVVQGVALVNSDFAQGTYAWSGAFVPIASIVSGLDDTKGGKVAQIAGTNCGVQHDQPIPVRTTRTYRVQIRVRRLAGTGGNFYAGARCYDSSGAELFSSVTATHPYTAMAGTVLPADGQWYTYSGQITGTTSTSTTDPNKFFDGTAKASVIAFALGASSDSVFQVDFLEIEDINDVSGAYAAVQTEASTRATVDGYLGAQYTVRVDVGGVVAGFGLSGTSAPGAGPQFDFIIRTNTFGVAPPSGSPLPTILPFAVQTTPTITAAGEVLPAGVYMDAAYIRNLEVVLGRFNTAIIGNALIQSVSASKILAGSLGVGEWIQSSAFTPGGTGFRIDGQGGVEIRNSGATRVFSLNASGAQPVLKVGTALELLANGNGTIGGITIDGSGIKSSNYVAGVSGFKFDAAGTAQLPATAVLGPLSTTNLIGAAARTTGTVNALTVASGAVSTDFSTATELTLDALTSGSSANVEGVFSGNFNITCASSFTGSGGTFKLLMRARLHVELWDGSAWTSDYAPGFGTRDVVFSAPMLLSNSESIGIPMTFSDIANYSASSGYTKARLRIVLQATVSQLQVNGGAAKTDVISTASLTGNVSIKQSPG